ncbi:MULTISPECIES: aspartate/glutamate racemase family protein [Streptomyces]|uniref:Arylsulfatase n=1 Tax=Streptomyces venezuelae TaxID=54571 RepID=A0A5P2BQZ3_STRVZ|nr:MULTISPECIES: aspartate/glutamate racemase family protein [Streptomyces]MYY86217.1 arylsulfatase [Streptomyces sp. SID335]MYZ19415.1 arylsulfatase [Streptomyces sp. SID337]NEB42826.1 arylsulfatase [Streptomyces sp. SID339]QES30789.1 arylsulfatase [Streptomyces venezuelae]
MDALGLLHTSPVHVPVFDGLRASEHPGLELRHHVEEELLARARREGPDAVVPAVRAALQRVADGGDAGRGGRAVRAVLCTCSTIGGVAEALGSELGVPVVRVDRPMAAAAVAAGPRVVLLATVASTVGPTSALVEEEARRAGRDVSVRAAVVEEAWGRFEAGDATGYAEGVARAVRDVRDADVIVLAQASMAGAEALVPEVRVPVLSSPRLGLTAAVALVAGSGRG